jgi:hypothetical protein
VAALVETLERLAVDVIEVPVREIDEVRAEQRFVEHRLGAVPPGVPVHGALDPRIDDEPLSGGFDAQAGVTDDLELHPAREG